MKVKLSHSSYVIKLYDALDKNVINDYFKDSLKNISELANNENLNGWELELRCIYREGEDIRVAKSTKPYVQDKLKLVTISIPIPANEVVPWGVNKEQLVPMPTKPGSEKYFTALEVDFKESPNLFAHVVSCIKKGISFALSDGITIVGNKIKVKDQLFS